MDYQENKHSMYLKVRTFDDMHGATIGADVPAWLASALRFRDKITNLELHLSQAALNKTGFAEHKMYLRLILRTKVIEMAGALLGLFLLNHEHAMVKKVTLTKSAFDRWRDTEIKHFVSHLVTTALDNVATLVDFGYDAARIAEVSLALTDYDDYIQKPGEERSDSMRARKITAELFDEVEDELAIMDAIMRSVSELHHGLSIQYFFDRRTDDMGGAGVPPNYIMTAEAGVIVVVFDLEYLADRGIKIKNLGDSDLSFGLSILTTSFTNPLHIVSARSSSTKASSTLGPNGNFLLVLNPSGGPILFEVTIFE